MPATTGTVAERCSRATFLNHFNKKYKVVTKERYQSSLIITIMVVVEIFVFSYFFREQT